jgi:PAS domain S-box-containing protein
LRPWRGGCEHPGVPGGTPLPGGGDDAAHAERLFALTQDLLGAADAEGRLRWVNAAWERMFGWTAAELRARPYVSFVHPDDRERLLAYAERLQAMPPGRSLGIEVRARTRAGDYRWVRLNSAVADPGPEPLVYISGTDITDLREALGELAEERARYGLLVGHLPDAFVFLFDTDLRVTLVGGPQLERRGYDPGGLIGMDLSEVSLIRWPEVEQRLHAALAGAPQFFEYQTEDAAIVYGVQLVPLRDPEGQVIGGMGVWRDVTELRRQTAELERSNAELERFASVVSHDLRQSLTSVTGFLMLLERRHAHDLDDDGRRLLGYALDAGERMRSLLDDLLAYARVGHSNREPQPVDAGELARTVAATVAGDAGVKVGELPVVRARPAELEQLLANLLGNAVKFVAPGRRAEVEVRAARDGSCGRFEVADNGVGVDPRDAERAFGMFARLHGADEYPGTGIGLAIAQKVVENAGGEIWVSPRDGGGSVFAFTWPAE